MSWQDIVLTFGTVVFIIGLLPSVFSDDKPATATSLMTGTALVAFVVAYVSLDLWFGAITTAILVGLWYILAVQQFRRKS